MIPDFKNLAILGQTGYGKTHLARALVAFGLVENHTIVYIQRAVVVYTPQEIELSSVPVSLLNQNQTPKPPKLIKRESLNYYRKTLFEVSDHKNLSSLVAQLNIFNNKQSNKDRTIVVFDEPNLSHGFFSELLCEIQSLPARILVIAQSPDCIDSRPVYEERWGKFLNNSLWNHFDCLIGKFPTSQRTKYEHIFPKMRNKDWQNLLSQVENTHSRWIYDQRHKLQSPSKLMEFSSPSLTIQQIAHEISRFIP